MPFTPIFVGITRFDGWRNRGDRAGYRCPPVAEDRGKCTAAKITRAAIANRRCPAKKFPRNVYSRTAVVRGIKASSINSHLVAIWSRAVIIVQIAARTVRVAESASQSPLKLLL